MKGSSPPPTHSTTIGQIRCLVFPIWQTWWSCQLFCPSFLTHIVNLWFTCWRLRAGSIVGFFLLGLANLLLCALVYATCVRCQVVIIQVIVGKLYLFLVCEETLIDTNSRYFLNLSIMCALSQEKLLQWRNWLMEPSQDIFDLVEDCFVRRVWGLGFVLIKPPISCHMYKRWMVVSAVEAFFVGDFSESYFLIIPIYAIGLKMDGCRFRV